MKAKLTIAGNGFFTISLTPETEAERDILRRVSECKELTSSDRLRDRNRPWLTDGSDQLEIFQVPQTIKPAVPLCDHGYNGLCPSCDALQVVDSSRKDQ